MSFHAKCTPRVGMFSLWEICNKNKTKSENTMILPMRIIAHINLLAFVPAHAHAITRVSGNSVIVASKYGQFYYFSSNSQP